MTDLRAAAQRVVDEMEKPLGKARVCEAVDALRAALEQPKQDTAVHMAHCNQGEHTGACKYGEEACPALAQEEQMLNGLTEAETLTTASVEGLARPEPEQEPVADSFTMDELTEAAVYAEIPDGQFQSLLIGLQEAVKQRAALEQPDPPAEPLHEDKIRAEFREMDRHCLPGEMTFEDWFEAGVRYAERQHEIV